ncbi:MAG TPA: substrate-binding domain-containing protein [Candidatus Dormibacteraeota bacterium]|nr:substrate-binding domain-containing protein [Candidatus Dormibacteraeota bacterium]
MRDVPGTTARPRGMVVALCTILMAGLAACGGAASGPPSGSASTSTSGNGCGTVGYVTPQDPDGVVARLPASARQDYNGYDHPVRASAWSSWKPTHTPVTIGLSWNQPVNDFAADVLNTVKNGLQATPGVGKVIVIAGASPSDTSAQVQQYNALLQQKPDLIVADVTVGTPFVPLVTDAARQGIPTVSVLSTISSPDVVNVVPNTYLAAAQTLAAAMKAIGGKGNILEVHGIPGISIDADSFRGFAQVLARCPNAKVIGQVTGNFSPAQAEAATLQFLGTHPQPIAAVAAAGGMATGIINAFIKAGRPVPVVTDQAALKGSLGYWRQHQSSYKGTATGGGAVGFGDLVVSVVQRMLAGDGVKVSDIVQPQPLITRGNLDRWAQPGWNLSTPGTAPDPPGAIDTRALLDPLFAR